MMEALTNSQFHLMTIDRADAKPVKLHARALPMSAAMVWSQQATAARAAADSATDYDAMHAAQDAVMSALYDYSGLTEGARGDVPEDCLEDATTEQLMGALEVLIDINCPLERTKRARAEREAEDVKKTQEILSALPPQLAAELLKEHLKSQSAT